MRWLPTLQSAVSVEDCERERILGHESTERGNVSDNRRQGSTPVGIGQQAGRPDRANRGRGWGGIGRTVCDEAIGSGNAEVIGGGRTRDGSTRESTWREPTRSVPRACGDLGGIRGQRWGLLLDPGLEEVVRAILEELDPKLNGPPSEDMGPRRFFDLDDRSFHPFGWGALVETDPNDVRLGGRIVDENRRPAEAHILECGRDGLELSLDPPAQEDLTFGHGVTTSLPTVVRTGRLFEEPEVCGNHAIDPSQGPGKAVRLLGFTNAPLPLI